MDYLFLFFKYQTEPINKTKVNQYLCIIFYLYSIYKQLTTVLNFAATFSDFKNYLRLKPQALVISKPRYRDVCAAILKLTVVFLQ